MINVHATWRDNVGPISGRGRTPATFGLPGLYRGPGPLHWRVMSRSRPAAVNAMR